MMRIKLVTAAAVACSVAQPAFAATTITGSITSVAFRSGEPGLVITANPIAFAPVTLANVGDSQNRDVLTVGTTEGTVNTDFLSLFGEDTQAYPISAAFSFSTPAGVSGSPVTGSTFGFIQPFTACGIIAGGCGRVDWGAPSVFTFGNGGRFSVELFDATFATPGNATVAGRFTLLAAPVPEPATWAMMILGFTIVGGAMRARPGRALSLG